MKKMSMVILAALAFVGVSSTAKAKTFVQTMNLNRE